jgi:hypothetical protein
MCAGRIIDSLACCDHNRTLCDSHRLRGSAVPTEVDVADAHFGNFDSRAFWRVLVELYLFLGFVVEGLGSKFSRMSRSL